MSEKRNAIVSMQDFLAVFVDREQFPTATEAAESLGMNVKSYNVRCSQVKKKFGHLPQLAELPSYPRGGGGAGRKITDADVLAMLAGPDENSDDSQE